MLEKMLEEEISTRQDLINQELSTFQDLADKELSERETKLLSAIRETNYPKLLQLRDSARRLAENQIIAMQQYERYLFLSTKKTLSKAEWCSTIQNGIQVLEMSENEKVLQAFQWRVEKVKNAAYFENTDHLVALVFEPRKGVERKKTLFNLLKELIPYAVKINRRHTLLPVLHRLFTELQILKDDYEYNMKKIATLMECDLKGLEQIQLLLDLSFFEFLDITRCSLEKRYSTDVEVINLVAETRITMEKIVIKFLVKIIGLVNEDDIEFAKNLLAQESLEVINRLLSASPLKEIESCCKKVVVFFDSILESSCKVTPDLLGSFGCFSQVSRGGLSESIRSEDVNLTDSFRRNSL